MIESMISLGVWVSIVSEGVGKCVWAPIKEWKVSHQFFCENENESRKSDNPASVFKDNLGI